MTASIVQVQYDTLEDVIKRFDDQADETSVMIRGLVSAVEQLRGGAWVGEAATSFYREMDEELFPTLERLEEAFVSAGQFTGFVIDTIETAEQEAADLFTTEADYGGVDPNGLDDDLDNDSSGGKLGDNARIVGYEPSSDPLYVGGAGDTETTSFTLPDILGGGTIEFETGDVHPNDIAQGQIGDCFLATALASVSDQNPGLIKQAIQPNDDGTYTVTFYENGSPVEITVTSDFPIREVYDKETDTWISSNRPPHLGDGDSELWPRIIEKAYASWKGDGDVTKGYQILNKGGKSADVLAAISGSDSSRVDPDKYSLEQLSTMHEQGQALTLSSLKSEEGKDKWYDAGDGELVRRHAYWIESIDVETGMITVRNPWGYSDSDRNKIEIPYSELDDSFRELTVNSLGK